MQSKIKIAFADDHILIRRSIIDSLKPYQQYDFIIEANNGCELLDKMTSSKSLPDICLLDISMPEMNGFETLIELKKRWPQVKVLILTMFENSLYFTKMISEGASGYLTKVCTPDKLVFAINSVFSSGYYNPDKIAQALSESIKDRKKNNFQITEVEKIFLKYCCSDLTYKDIAEKMKITKKSVEGHRDYLFKKLGVNSRPSLVIFAIQHGIIFIDR